MSCHNFVGLCVLFSVAIVTGENYIVSNDQTFWNGTPCTLGVPSLVYSAETGWRAEKSNLQITHDDEVWIGYTEATFVFQYFDSEIAIFGDSLQNNNHCLVFKPYQTYSWKECTRSYRVLCSNWTNKRLTAIRQAVHMENWYQANSYCFDQGLYLATIDSIRNANFSDSDTEDNWTSYIRTSLVMKANIQGFNFEPNHIRYAYMLHDGKVNCTECGQRRSLCEDTTALKQKTRQTNSSPTHLEDEANQMMPKSQSAVTIGISLPIGFVVLLTVAIILLLLKKRGSLKCIKHRSANKASDNLEGKASDQDSNDDNDGVHNFFVLEKCVQRANTTFDNSGLYNDACNTKEPEGHHSFVVNDKQEPFEDGVNASANYNYTRVVKATKRVTRSPDNIYNKLSVDHHNDYDHLGTVRQDHAVGIETSDEYNTTAAVLAVTKGFRGDASAYNQVNFNRSKLHASGNDVRNYVITTYDVTQQAEFRFETEDMSGYAHVSKDC